MDTASDPTAAAGHGLLCIASVDAGGRARAATELAAWSRPWERGAMWAAFGQADFVAWREARDPGELITPATLTSVVGARTMAARAVPPPAGADWLVPLEHVLAPGPGWQVDGRCLPLGALVSLRVHPLVMLARLEDSPRSGIVDAVLGALVDDPPPVADAVRVAVLRGHEDRELLLWARAESLDALADLVAWLRARRVPADLPYDDDLLRQLAPSAFGRGQEIGWHGLPVLDRADATVLMPLAWGGAAPEGARRLLAVETEGGPRVGSAPALDQPASTRPLAARLRLEHPPAAAAEVANLLAAWTTLGVGACTPTDTPFGGAQRVLTLHDGTAPVRVSDLSRVLQLTLGDAGLAEDGDATLPILRARGAPCGLSFETSLALSAAPAPEPTQQTAPLAAGFRALVDRKRRAGMRGAGAPDGAAGLLELWTTEAQHAGMPWAFRARVANLVRRWSDGLLADPERHAVALDVLRTLQEACLRHREQRSPNATPRPALVLDGPVGQAPGFLHVDAVLPLVEALEAFLAAEPTPGRPGPLGGTGATCGRRRSVEIIGGAVRVFGAQWGLADHVVMVADSDDAILQAHPVGRRTLLVRLPRGATEDPLMLTLGPTLAFAWMERTPLRSAVRRNPDLQDAIDGLLRATSSRPALPEASIRDVLAEAQRALGSLQQTAAARAIGWLVARLPALRLGRRVLRRTREPETRAARWRERLLHGPLVVRTCVDAVVRSGHRVQEAVEAGVMALLLSAEVSRRPRSEDGDWRTRAHNTLRFALDNPHFFDPANAVHPTPGALPPEAQPLVLDMLRALCEDLGVGPDVMVYGMGRLADDLDSAVWVGGERPRAPRLDPAVIVQAWLDLIPELDRVPRPTPGKDPLHEAFLDYLDGCLPPEDIRRAAGPWPLSVPSANGAVRHRTRGFIVERELSDTEQHTRSRRCADQRRPICLLRSGGRIRTGEAWEAEEIRDRAALLDAFEAHGGRSLGAIFVDREAGRS